MGRPIPTEPAPRATPEDVAPAADRPSGGVPRATAAAVLVTDLVCAFGFVLGFNQLGTQSPIDAILPVALVSVGIAGVPALVAAVLGARRSWSTEEGPAALTPPTVDQGFTAFGLGILAIAAVGWRWGVAAQAAIVAAHGVILLLNVERGVVLTARGDPRRPSTYRLCLAAPEAVLFIGFSWAALADGGVRPFT